MPSSFYISYKFPCRDIKSFMPKRGTKVLPKLFDGKSRLPSPPFMQSGLPPVRRPFVQPGGGGRQPPEADEHCHEAPVPAALSPGAPGGDDRPDGGPGQPAQVTKAQLPKDAGEKISPASFGCQKLRLPPPWEVPLLPEKVELPPEEENPPPLPPPLDGGGGGMYRVVTARPKNRSSLALSCMTARSR